MTPSPPTGSPVKPYVWETCLDAKNSDGTAHLDQFNPRLLDSIAHAPRVLLDIGCSSGAFAQAVKNRHPACRTIGIEPNKASAALAAQKLDQVLCGRFEDFDLVAEGIAHGSVDTVVAADVLEHMYDPWHAMTALRPYLSGDAQIILSIPNTRHLGLTQRLIDGGMWTYAEKGLLDITHIRFFTLREIHAFLGQTGYRMEHVNYFLDHNFQPLYDQNKDRTEINIDVGRLTLRGISPQELAELCTWQFFVRARLA
jgi:O-antigen biosynthesis protein